MALAAPSPALRAPPQTTELSLSPLSAKRPSGSDFFGSQHFAHTRSPSKNGSGLASRSLSSGSCSSSRRRHSISNTRGSNSSCGGGGGGSSSSTSGSARRDQWRAYAGGIGGSIGIGGGCTHYDVLGISRDASQDDVKSAFRRLARTLHPDVTHGDDADDRFRIVLEAYQVLSDAKHRASYDRTLPPVRSTQAHAWPATSWSRAWSSSGGGGSGSSSSSSACYDSRAAAAAAAGSRSADYQGRVADDYYGSSSGSNNSSSSSYNSSQSWQQEQQPQQERQQKEHHYEHQGRPFRFRWPLPHQQTMRAARRTPSWQAASSSPASASASTCASAAASASAAAASAAAASISGEGRRSGGTSVASGEGRGSSRSGWWWEEADEVRGEGERWGGFGDPPRARDGFGFQHNGTATPPGVAKKAAGRERGQGAARREEDYASEGGIPRGQSSGGRTREGEAVGGSERGREGFWSHLSSSETRDRWQASAARQRSPSASEPTSAAAAACTIGLSLLRSFLSEARKKLASCWPPPWSLFLDVAFTWVSVVLYTLCGPQVTLAWLSFVLITNSSAGGLGHKVAAAAAWQLGDMPGLCCAVLLHAAAWVAGDLHHRAFGVVATVLALGKWLTGISSLGSPAVALMLLRLLQDVMPSGDRSRGARAVV